MTSSPDYVEPFAPRTPRIIGRQEIIQAIEAAIGDSSGCSHVFLLVGPGGTGKTRLLEEVPVICGRIAKPEVRPTSIIDLYHADYHSPGGLRQAIVDGLDPDQGYFQQYRVKRKEFEQKREEGIGGGALEQVRQELDKVFLQEYEELAQTSRLVLCFDTLELLQYESDRVLEICQVEDVDTAIKNWFLRHIGRLPNTVALFSGRPQPRIEQEFAEQFRQSNCSFTRYDINAFTVPETYEYLVAMRAESQELDEILSNDEVGKRVVQLSGGKPIYLSLLTDLLLYGDTITDLFPASQDAKDDVDEDLVGKLLVERLIALPEPFGPTIYYLLHARKGLDVVLLRHLMGGQWSAEEASRNLEQVRHFAFVKPRAKTPYLFLHDEVYDLFDRYFQGDSRYGNSFEAIATYYRTQMAKVSSILEREDLVVARLYYELQVDLRNGYAHCYLPWDEQAIQAHEIGFDMRLRDEVLRFLNRYTAPDSPFYNPRIGQLLDRAAIDRDCIIGWLMRYLEKGESEKVYKIAWDLRYQRKEAFVDWERIDDPRYKVSVLIPLSWAMVYLGKAETETRKVQEEALALLADKQQFREAQESWRLRALGHIHENIGYLHRVAQRLQTAIGYYSTAVHYFRQVNQKANLASAQNNEAYAYALLGNFSRAEKLIDDALTIRRSLKQKHPLAISLNTRGLIHLLADQPHRALPKCKEAEQIFTDLNDPRGIGLSTLALAQIYRALGKLWRQDVYPVEQAVEFYQESRLAIDKAIKIFEEETPEPGRLIEAYNEAGALERDWGLVLKKMGGKELARQRFDRAVKLFAASIAISGAQWPVETSDSYEDIVDVYIIQADFTNAVDNLRQSESFIPEEYRLVEGQGFMPIKEPVEEFWSMLGKLEIQQARIVLAGVGHELQNITQERLLAAMPHYAKSVAYFLRFSADYSRHKTTIKEIYDYLKSLEIAQLQEVRDVVVGVEQAYQVDLQHLLEDIDETLALAPQLTFS